MMYLRVYIKWQHLIIGIDITGHRAVARCPTVFEKVFRFKNKKFLNMLFASINKKEVCKNFKVICLT